MYYLDLFGDPMLGKCSEDLPNSGQMFFDFSGLGKIVYEENFKLNDNGRLFLDEIPDEVMEEILKEQNELQKQYESQFDIDVDILQRFKSWGIDLLLEKGIPFDRAVKYDKKFDAQDIVDLDYNNFDIDIVNKLAGHLSGELAAKYLKMDGDVDDIEHLNVNLLEDVITCIDTIFRQKVIDFYNELDNMRDFEYHHLDEEEWEELVELEHPQYPKIESYGFGYTSIVIRDGNRVIKFMPLENISQEYEILEMIKGSENLVNVIENATFYQTCSDIGLEDEFLSGIILELIEGKSIEKHIYSKKFTDEETKKYSSDIINGLVQMRRASIDHHNDLKTKNIMIDEKNDKAVIIDFGYASHYGRMIEDPKGSRAYGSNDLVALAQIMYEMKTGKHLFNETSKPTDEAKNEIAFSRESFYSDQMVEKRYLDKIDEEIQDKALNKMIKECLNAKPYQYRKIQRVFENCNC